MAPTSVSLSRQLVMVNRQPDATRLDLTTVTANIQKVKDENDKLCSSLAALRVAFQTSHPSLLGLRSQFDSVFSQQPLTDDVDDEAL